jgi:hypothetical protein
MCSLSLCHVLLPYENKYTVHGKGENKHGPMPHQFSAGQSFREYVSLSISFLLCRTQVIIFVKNFAGCHAIVCTTTIIFL